MAFDNDKDRRRKPDHHHGQTDEAPKARRKRASPEVGQALRAAYQQAVSEDIPPEMLDLLGKLG